MRLQKNQIARSAMLLALSAVAGSSFATELDELVERAALHVSRLNGDYGFTTLQSCVRTPYQQPPAQGIDPVTLKFLVPGEAAEAVGSGVMTFSRDGSVTADVQGAELSVNRLAVGQAAAASGIKYSCSGNYTVDADSRLVVNFPSCTVNTGNPNAVVTVAPLNYTGFVGVGKQALTLSLVDGLLQSVSVADASGNKTLERQRLCIQSMSLTKLPAHR